MNLCCIIKRDRDNRDFLVPQLDELLLLTSDVIGSSENEGSIDGRQTYRVLPDVYIAIMNQCWQSFMCFGGLVMKID